MQWFGFCILRVGKLDVLKLGEKKNNKWLEVVECIQLCSVNSRTYLFCIINRPSLIIAVETEIFIFHSFHYIICHLKRNNHSKKRTYLRMIRPYYPFLSLCMQNDRLHCNWIYIFGNYSQKGNTCNWCDESKYWIDVQKGVFQVLTLYRFACNISTRKKKRV